MRIKLSILEVSILRQVVVVQLKNLVEPFLVLTIESVCFLLFLWLTQRSSLQIVQIGWLHGHLPDQYFSDIIFLSLLRFGLLSLLLLFANSQVGQRSYLGDDFRRLVCHQVESSLGRHVSFLPALRFVERNNLHLALLVKL
jgi:hypothetical protein